MSMTLAEAKEVLRIDTNDTDNQIQALLNAISSYIEDCTGLAVSKQDAEPLCKVLSHYLLIQWYEHTEESNITIRSLLKTLKLKTQAQSQTQSSEGVT